MKKSEMLEEIRTICSAIKKCLEDSEIKEKHFFVHPESSELTAAIIKEAHQWLMGLYRLEYKEYLDIKSKAPESQWRAYKMFDMGSAQEVKLLKQAIKKVRAKIINKNKPIFFKKGKVNVLVEQRKKKTKSRASGNKKSTKTKQENGD